jgi:hypothetical protein
MKLFERLGIKNFDGETTHLKMLNRAESESPKTDFEAAWNKLNRSELHGLVALDYYLLDDPRNTAKYARACLKQADEFLFGNWRNEFKTPDGRIEPRWWKERFTWMEVFGHCLLWGSALADWDFLKRVSAFPEENACLSMGTKPQDRDSFVAIATMLKGCPSEKCVHNINRLSAGPKKGGKLLSVALLALLNADAAAFGESLTAYLQQYKKGEFPKEELTSRISIEGTLLMRWGRHLGIKVEVPNQFQDHIVELKA